MMKSSKDWKPRSRTRYVRSVRRSFSALVFTTLSLGQAIYLERLKLQITFLPSRNPETYRCFAPRDYEQLLQLLQRTNLQQLQLAWLERIPDTPSNVVIGSVRLLRLSGNCSFKDSVKYASLRSRVPRTDGSPSLAIVPKPLRATLSPSLSHSTSSGRILVLRRIVKCGRNVKVQGSVTQFPLSRTRRTSHVPSKYPHRHLHLPRRTREEGNEVDSDEQGGGLCKGLLDSLNV